VREKCDYRSVPYADPTRPDGRFFYASPIETRRKKDRWFLKSHSNVNPFIASLEYVRWNTLNCLFAGW